MNGNSFQKHPNTLKLLLAKNTLLNQGETTVRHLKILVITSIGEVKKRFVAPPLLRYQVKLLPTCRTPNAIGFQGKSKLFVPVLLLLSKKDKSPSTVPTKLVEIIIMRYWERRRRLSCQVSFYGCAGDYTGAVVIGFNSPSDKPLHCV
jgi:hypothetical protein